MVEVKVLPPERWKEARDLRFKALQSDPTAFGSSFEEEESFSEAEWQRRMKNALFALHEDKPVGTITYIFGDKIKSKHVARIFAVYVHPDYRRLGIGRKLLETALEQIQNNKEIGKVQLFVNKDQAAAVALYRRAGFSVAGELSKEIKVGDKFY